MPLFFESQAYYNWYNVRKRLKKLVQKEPDTETIVDFRNFCRWEKNHIVKDVD